ncbi:MAG: CpsD/CapB family tyrosine-protein kinase, partial [Deltaproteobacteria bacterium]|nr:CpsD/CapB family tyrosine-protein kinase [Deltaproteobacteria bacterium]
RQIFAGIYQNMALTAADKAPKSILVCAANRQEGASTVALGLALAAAEQQTEKVLLIDGNFHTPQVCGAFGLPESSGLGDLIAGRVNPGAVVRKTPAGNLWVMGAGVAHLGHVKSLEPPNLQDLLQVLAQQFPLVLIDGPALNSYPESVLYAAQADRIYLVVHSGVTRVPVIKTALAKLAPEVGGKVEIILNRRIFHIPAWIYKKL